MLFTRTAVAVGVAVALMPSDPEKQQALLASTQENVAWAATYCEREPDACDQAKAVWDGFVAKAQFGAQLAKELAGQYAEVKAGQAASDGAEAGAQTAMYDASEQPPLEQVAYAEPAPKPARPARARTTTLKPLPVKVHRAPAAPDVKPWDQFQPD
jgi:hypothetical protein